MGASRALLLEQFLEGKGLIRASHGGAGLLTGSGAKLLRACDLPSSSGAWRRLLEVGSNRRRPGEGEPAETFLRSLVRSGVGEGGLAEVVGRRSSGRFSIALAALASATGSGQDAALVDLGDQLDPQMAEGAGVDLARLLWVRPRRVKEALAAAEMLLATGFRLVVAEMGLSPRGGRFVPDAAWVRLARAAKAQESTLLLLAPYRMSGIAAEAVVSAAAARPIWQGSGRAPRLLTGISARLTLEKLGRETPGYASPLTLYVSESFSFGARFEFPNSNFEIEGEGETSVRALDFLSNHKSQITNHKSSSSLPASPRLRVSASSSPHPPSPRPPVPPSSSL